MPLIFAMVLLPPLTSHLLEFFHRVFSKLSKFFSTVSSILSTLSSKLSSKLTFEQHLHASGGSSHTDGFSKYIDQLDSNRDGKKTAFSMGCVLSNQIHLAPVAHSYRQASRDSGLTEFIQRYNELLGEIGGLVMNQVMNQEFLDICRDR